MCLARSPVSPPRSSGERASFCLATKPCQGRSLIYIIRYHNVYVKLVVYTHFMPRAFKSPLPPVETGISVGKNLAMIRKKRGLSQAQLAQQIGITQTLVSDYETGRLHLNDEMIIRFAISLGTSADAILGLHGTEGEQETPLRISKRLQKIKTLPSGKQKTVLQALDLALKAVGAEDTPQENR